MCRIFDTRQICSVQILCCIKTIPAWLLSAGTGVALQPSQALRLICADSHVLLLPLTTDGLLWLQHSQSMTGGEPVTLRFGISSQLLVCCDSVKTRTVCQPVMEPAPHRALLHTSEYDKRALHRSGNCTTGPESHTFVSLQ